MLKNKARAFFELEQLEYSEQPYPTAISTAIQLGSQTAMVRVRVDSGGCHPWAHTSEHNSRGNSSHVAQNQAYQ